MWSAWPYSLLVSFSFLETVFYSSYLDSHTDLCRCFTFLLQSFCVTVNSKCELRFWLESAFILSMSVLFLWKALGGEQLKPASLALAILPLLIFYLPLYVSSL